MSVKYKSTRKNTENSSPSKNNLEDNDPNL